MGQWGHLGHGEALDSVDGGGVAAERVHQGAVRGSIRAEAVMDPLHVGEAVLMMANLPIEANVQFMTVMATKMPFVGRG